MRTDHVGSLELDDETASLVKALSTEAPDDRGVATFVTIERPRCLEEESKPDAVGSAILRTLEIVGRGVSGTPRRTEPHSATTGSAVLRLPARDFGASASAGASEAFFRPPRPFKAQEAP
jgi:hypothetical protein